MLDGNNNNQKLVDNNINYNYMSHLLFFRFKTLAIFIKRTAKTTVENKHKTSRHFMMRRRVSTFVAKVRSFAL